MGGLRCVLELRGLGGAWGERGGHGVGAWGSLGGGDLEGSSGVGGWVEVWGGFP